MEATAGGLRVCEPRWQATLAGEHTPTADQAGGIPRWHWQDRLAHVLAFLLDPIASSGPPTSKCNKNCSGPRLFKAR